MFASVSVLVALVSPSVKLPKPKLAGVSVTGAIPVAARPTVCGLLDAEKFAVSVPAGCAPRAVGVTVSATVQLRPAPSVGFKQVEVGSMAYGVPDVTASDEMLILVARLFVRVTVFRALVWPNTTLPKVN